MNQKLAPILVVIVVLVGGAYLVLKHPATSNSSTGSSSSYKQSAACNLFTLSAAKQSLGQSAALDNSQNTNVSANDVDVTTCTYNDSGTSTTATALVRSAMTASGVSTNKTGYDQQKKTDLTTPVTGVGEEAFYDTSLGQLSVIKGNDWILVTSGGLMPADHSRSQATQIAQDMLAKL